MDRDVLRERLDRSGVIRSACDLDLLLFFARHSPALVTTEELAMFTGYDLKRVTETLERLLAAGVVTLEQAPGSAAYLYVFSGAGPDGGSLAELLHVASSRGGRRAIIRALTEGSGAAMRRPIGFRGGRRLARAA